MENTRHVGVRMPESLIRWLDLEAERTTRTRSQMLIHLLREQAQEKPGRPTRKAA